MRRSDQDALRAMIAVADHGAFVRAAEALNLSTSALSQQIRDLERRLGVRLFHRTTRSVSPTDAGARLLARVRPLLAGLEDAFEEASAAGDRPSGRLRINASQLATRHVLAPRIASFLRNWPEVRLEIASDDRLIDIVAEGYDAGVRLGESLQADMISVPLGPPLRQRVVASPAYLAGRGVPASPADLDRHACLNVRWPTSGRIYRWELQGEDGPLNLEVDGPLISSDGDLLARAAADGLGLALLFEMEVGDALADGRLTTVLDAWTPPFAGFHLYYSSRRHLSPALRAFIDHVRTESGA